VLIAGSELVVYGTERLYTALPSGRNWAMHDGLGSVRQLLDGSGASTNQLSYDPYGPPRGTLLSHYGFIEELQSTSGLTYLRARWYHPSSDTLLGRDSFAGMLDQPANQHYFQCAYGNPVNWTDPTGRTGHKSGGIADDQDCPPGFVREELPVGDETVVVCVPPAPGPNNPSGSRRTQPEETLGDILEQATTATLPGIGTQGGVREGPTVRPRSGLEKLLAICALIGVFGASRVMQDVEPPQGKSLWGVFPVIPRLPIPWLSQHSVFSWFCVPCYNSAYERYTAPLCAN
jgi:RHS repeat-associated protein